jgi:hypothetical protein
MQQIEHSKLIQKSEVDHYVDEKRQSALVARAQDSWCHARRARNCLSAFIQFGLWMGILRPLFAGTLRFAAGDVS